MEASAGPRRVGAAIRDEDVRLSAAIDKRGAGSSDDACVPAN